MTPLLAAAAEGTGGVDVPRQVNDAIRQLARLAPPPPGDLRDDGGGVAAVGGGNMAGLDG
ncbi:MAG: hypothetical protein WKF86_00560 [Acidimicrobiales bacterium]